MRRLSGLALALAIAPSVYGCASPCKRIAEHHSRHLRRESSASTPHMVVSIPFEVIDNVVMAELRDVRSITVPLPRLDIVGVSLGRVQITLESVAMQPAREGYVAFRARLGVRDRGRRLFAMDLDGEAKPAIDPSEGTVTFALGLDNLRDVRPEIKDTARFADALYDRLPTAARIVVSRSDLKKLASKLATDLVSQSWPMLRDRVFADIGEITRVTLDLPDLPLDTVAIRSISGPPGYLELAVSLDLPVHHGLQGAGGRPADMHRNLVAVRASGSAVAELANFAMKTGQLPSRYDLEGEPNPAGHFRPALDWKTGPRPLKVHIWDSEKECAYLRFGGTPKVSLDPEGVVVRVDDGKVEDARGRAKVRAWAWFHRVGRHAFTVTEQVSGRIELDVGGEPLAAEVVSVARSADEVVVGLQLRLERKPARRRR